MVTRVTRASQTWPAFATKQTTNLYRFTKPRCPSYFCSVQTEKSSKIPLNTPTPVAAAVVRCHKTSIIFETASCVPGRRSPSSRSRWAAPNSLPIFSPLVSIKSLPFRPPPPQNQQRVHHPPPRAHPSLARVVPQAEPLPQLGHVSTI